MTLPDRIGKYQITELLGEGAMGVVYKAFDPDIRRVVALKTIRRELDDGGDQVDSIAARFRNEAQAAGRLQHPGIVGVYEYGEDGRTAFIAMEYVEGNSLSHYLRNKVRFTDDDIHSVICQLLDALDHAHGLGVWHRDVKPANLIMTRAGRLKMADFGIARIESVDLTRAQNMIGTPSYMAPEQVLGRPIDRRVDIWAAGVLLYRLLADQPPFVGSADALMYKVVHEAPPAIADTEVGRQRPRAYDAIVATALAKEADQRYPSAAAFHAAVRSAIGRAARDAVSEPTVIAVPPRQPVARSEPPAPNLVSTAGSASTSQLPTHWDAKVLAQVETQLARHVGPMAAVMVRRAARDCADLAALYARLADQVANSTLRDLLRAQAAQVPALSTGSGSHPPAAPGAVGATAIDDALRERAERLLAQHLGPIARVVVRKAAAATADRDAFGVRLSEAIVDGAQRRKFLDAFERLP